MTKQETWDCLVNKFSNMTDGLGLPIDTGILPLVVALNALGMETSSSCQGHREEDLTPYVDLEIVISPDEHKRAINALHYAQKQEAMELLSEGEIQSLQANANHLFNQLNIPGLKLRQRVSGYLRRFYQHHSADYETQLTITSMISFGCIMQVRLENQGAPHFTLEDPHKKTDILLDYQAEMKIFAEFLQSCYLNGG